jgi:hypothetical protein
VKAYIEKIQAEDLTKFLGGVEVSLSAELARSIVVDLAWNEVYRLLKSGERDVGRLAAAGQAQITAAGPPGAANDPIAQKRIQSLLAAASRIAPAYRASAPPEIDGRPTENVWKWVDQDPWFAWKSGSASTFKTQFALAYDDTHLYVALRCPQADLAKMTRCEGYGASAWKYASVEIHLNPDARDAGPKEIPYFQTIPAYGGGMWEKEQRATEKYAVTDNGKDLFEVELSVSLQKLRMTPKDFPYLRINFIRNIAAGGHSGLGWFPSTGAHASYDARGWVVFVP